MIHAFLGFSGRLGRGGWWAGQGLLLVGVIGMVFAPLFLGEPMIYTINNSPTLNNSPQIPAMWKTQNLVIFGVIYAWIFLATTAKRFHDVGRSGLWALIGMVPPALHLLNISDCAICGEKSFIPYLPLLAMATPTIVSFALMGYCGSTPGDIGENHYGPPPGSGSKREIKEAKPSQQFAKLDDAYFADYARKLANQIAAVGDPPHAQTSNTPTATPTFGKR